MLAIQFQFTHLLTAAYEIIHVVSRKRNRTRDLLFDSLVIKDEYRSEFNIAVKKPANFFKHAEKDDPDSTIEYSTTAAEAFMLFAIMGLHWSGEGLTATESAFLMWFVFHEPNILNEDGAKVLSQRFRIEELDEIRSIQKGQFLETFRRGGIPLRT
jgi:hypothetical protein